MTNAEAISVSTFRSRYTSQQLIQLCTEDLEFFRTVPGLIQKYYFMDEGTDTFSETYIFESPFARTLFWSSPFAKDMTSRYSIIKESFRLKQYEMAIVLNDSLFM